MALSEEQLRKLREKAAQNEQEVDDEQTYEDVPFESNGKKKKKSDSNYEKPCCPKCGSDNIQFMREQSGTVGAAQNKVTVMAPKRSHGCLYWLIIGWWWEPILWIFRKIFGGFRRGGWNASGSKNMIHTQALCQNCGYSWKIK